VQWKSKHSVLKTNEQNRITNPTESFAGKTKVVRASPENPPHRNPEVAPAIDEKELRAKDEIEQAPIAGIYEETQFKRAKPQITILSNKQ